MENVSRPDLLRKQRIAKSRLVDCMCLSSRLDLELEILRVQKRLDEMTVSDSRIEEMAAQLPAESTERFRKKMYDELRDKEIAKVYEVYKLAGIEKVIEIVFYIFL